jgi:hypothetical protein
MFRCAVAKGEKGFMIKDQSIFNFRTFKMGTPCNKFFLKKTAITVEFHTTKLMLIFIYSRGKNRYAEIYAAMKSKE